MRIFSEHHCLLRKLMVLRTPRDSVQDKNMSDILCQDKDMFKNAIEEMKKDDSRSYMLRFGVRSGPLSILPKDLIDSPMSPDDVGIQTEDQERILILEAQGILICDRTTGDPSHVGFFLQLCKICSH